MAADYDRLFQIPDGEAMPDEAPAEIETEFEIDPPSPTLPTPTDPPKPNGQAPLPMPVDWTDQPLARPETPAAPMPVDWTEQAPPARPETPAPPMPVDWTPRPPSGRPEPAPFQPGPRTQAPAHPARHARRGNLDPADNQYGHAANPQNSHRANSHRANSQHGRRAAAGASNPPRPRADSSGVAPKGGPAPPPMPLRQSGRNFATPPGPARAPTQPFAQSPPARNGAAQTDSLSALAAGDHRARGAVSHIGVQSGAKKSAAKPVSQRGWRRGVHKLTRINVGLSRAEKYELDLRTRIRRSPRGSYQIGVLGLKGGVGKTTLTVTLGSVLAQVRRDRILAFDADADSGNLADRVGRQSPATIADLLADQHLSHYNDIRAHTSANAVNLEVLAAADYSVAPRALNEADWHFAADAVSRFYNIVLADCGPGLFDPATRGVLATVSATVIVTSASIDGARQAAVAIDWLRNNGRQDLLSRTCVVINHVVPGEPSIAVADLVRQFEHHVQSGRVIVLPWDKHIAAGTEIRLDQLGATYARRVTELAAALSDDFDRGERR
jgi:MinD-like ATPase involved in chromosome partitioning or flagellar assembly